MEPIQGGIIDFHAHVFPDALAQKAVTQIGRHYGIRMNGSGLLGDLAASACRPCFGSAAD